jgi:signal transduction histidine kinase
MQNQLIQTDQKLAMIVKHSSMGIAEIDREGKIIHLNPKGSILLKPIRIAHGIGEINLYPVLDRIAPAISKKITDSTDTAGHIVSNETHSFNLSFGGENIERHFNFTVIKMFTDCIIVGFDDITQKWQKDVAIQHLLSEKAILQGKFEIASNILHDIGNALVGFGSYINRIKRSLEQNNPDNLQKLTDFVTAQQQSLTTAFGDAKSGALIQMLGSLTDAHKNTHGEIRKSVGEQLNIITHIQEILNIQRQYTSGHETQEKNPVNLRSIVNDCMSMVMSSIEKRGIEVTVSAPEKIPVIKGDRTRLMQVILNILKNSIEAIDIYAAEKKIAFTISTQADILVLEVKDNGHGFDKGTATHLFERGFTTKASGSGIGLSSCRSIIESHDGKINISSEGFGKGALTTIQFKIHNSI